MRFAGLPPVYVQIYVQIYVAGPVAGPRSSCEDNNVLCGAGRGAGVWAWRCCHGITPGKSAETDHRDNEATETFVAAKLSNSLSQDWRTLLHILMANQHYINTVIWAMLQ